jgi:predicted Rossmann fold flavoprotein
MNNYDVVIIGAGAAGMMCAIEAGRRGRSVLVLDHARSVGEKIRISGGGRCNFTNLDMPGDRFLSQNQRFALSPLARFTQWDFIAMLEATGIAYHEKTLGQLFCDGSARQIVAMLVRHLAEAAVQVQLGIKIRSVARSTLYEITLADRTITASSLVVACGGKSVPKMGATGFGYDLARQFGVKVIDTRPALVPLTFARQELDRIGHLAGTALRARVSCRKTSFAEGLLITHRGLSGPSILQISSYWRDGQSIHIDLVPDSDVLTWLRDQRAVSGRQSIQNALARFMPKKLADYIARLAGVQGNLADQSDKALQSLAATVHGWQVKPVGSEGYRTAEVTLGGVDTGELDAGTMQVRTRPGLYFIGEVVDVTGWLGGYNLQWAWSSGWVAGQVV